MKNFNFKKRNLVSGPHLLGTLLILAGLFALASPTFLKVGSTVERILTVGIGAIIIGILIVMTYEGTVIDFSQKRFKEYLSIGGFKIGKWMDLPDILNIKVISASFICTNTPNGISPTLSGKVTKYKTFLYSNSSESILAFEYSNDDKALKDAKFLSANFNADLTIKIS